MERSKWHADTELDKYQTRHAAERIRILIPSARHPSDDENHAVETPNFYPPISEPNVRYQQQGVLRQHGRIADLRCGCKQAQRTWSKADTRICESFA